MNILGLLILWLGTIVISMGVNISVALKMIKDIADAGYKLDYKRLSELGDLNPNNGKILRLATLIPMLNIMYSMNLIIQYNNQRDFMLTQLRVMDTLEKMSKEEQEEYEKNPTFLNAILISANKELNKKPELSISVNDQNGNLESKVFFEIKDGNINILRTVGKASELSIEEQIKMVKDTLKGVTGKIIEEYGDVESFATEVVKSKNNNIVFDSSSENEDQKEDQLSNIDKQKQALENLRSELVGKENDDSKSKIKAKH